MKKTLRNSKTQAPQTVSGRSLADRVRTANRWRDQLNPLRGLTLTQAVSMLESAQVGQFASLQWTYSFIERRDAILRALVERRSSAVLEMDWDIKIVNQQRYKNTFDQKLADDQRDSLLATYNQFENLSEAIEHFTLASFRGYAHTQIQGKKFENLDQWNWIRNGLYGDWYWNPSSLDTTATTLPPENRLDPVADRVLIREVKSPINEIALIKYIRSNLSQKDWDAFIEIFGIPGCIVIMPSDMDPSKTAEYRDAAEDVAEGSSGSLPYGSDVKFSDSPRGTAPFRPHLDYLNEQLVIAGTGGLLTMLAMSGSGTLAGGAHMEAFETIARAEAKKISELFQKQFDKLELAREFPGKPVLAYFDIAANEETSVTDIIDQVVKLSSAGYQIDPAELSEKTGYNLTLKPTPQIPADGFNLSRPADTTIRNRAPDSLTGEEPHAARDTQPGRVNFAASDAARALAQSGMQALAAAMGDDLAPLREKIEYVLTIEDPEFFMNALKNLQAELPAMLLEINANPKSAKALEDTFSSAAINGWVQAVVERTNTEAA